jgi:hypothetical protein
MDASGTCADASNAHCVGLSAPIPLNNNLDFQTYDSRYIGDLCSSGAWHLLYTPTGQYTGFTQAQLDATCVCIPPGDIATTTPTAGGSVNTDGAAVGAVSWSAATGATRYDIELYPMNSDCSSAQAHCSYSSAGGGVAATSYSFTAQTQWYTFRVRPVAACGGLGNWTTPVNFLVLSPISGTIIGDPGSTATLVAGLCSGSGTGYQPGAGSTVDGDNGVVTNSGAVAADGTYTLYMPFWSPGANLVTLSPGDASYVSSCPNGNSYGSISAPFTGLNFYVTQASDPFWQVIGGPVVAYAKTGQAIRSPILSTACVAPTCQPYLILQSAGAGTSGYLLTGGGSVDIGYETGNQTNRVDQDTKNVIGTVDSKVAKENFAYFLKRYQFPYNPVDDFPSTWSNATKPVLVPQTPDVKAYYRPGDLTITQPWVVNSGETYIIFVTGDLNIQNTITVANGGYLAFVVRGNIVVDPTVGSVDPTSTVGQVQGVYIADGYFRTASSGLGDLKFVGEGTFVAWSGFQLQRNYANASTGAGRTTNNAHPSELFKYRTDFLTNVPIEMQPQRTVWQQINP